MSTKPCAWCGSFDTYFKHYLCWEEDRFGNTETTLDLNDPDLTPKDELHWCNECDGGFVEPLPGDDYPTLPDDFIIPDEETGS
jgi:hypothetical protein